MTSTGHSSNFAGPENGQILQVVYSLFDFDCTSIQSANKAQYVDST